MRSLLLGILGLAAIYGAYVLVSVYIFRVPADRTTGICVSLGIGLIVLGFMVTKANNARKKLSGKVEANKDVIDANWIDKEEK